MADNLKPCRKCGKSAVNMGGMVHCSDFDVCGNKEWLCEWESDGFDARRDAVITDLRVRLATLKEEMEHARLRTTSAEALLHAWQQAVDKDGKHHRLYYHTTRHFEEHASEHALDALKGKGE